MLLFAFSISEFDLGKLILIDLDRLFHSEIGLKVAF